MWNEGAGTRPSTGQLAVAAAVHLCGGHVSVFGFDRTPRYSNQYHLREPRSPLHDWDMETMVRHGGNPHPTRRYLPKVDTKCTALSLIPTGNGNGSQLLYARSSSERKLGRSLTL